MPAEVYDIMHYYQHKRGFSEEHAKEVAIATYNKQHPDAPITRAHPHGGPKSQKGEKK